MLWIAALLGIAWLAPNSNEIMLRAQAYLFPPKLELRQTALSWGLTGTWAVGTALMLVTALSSMSRISEFLYFQF